VQTDDLASAVGVGRHRDYGGERDDVAALALLQRSGVKPQLRHLPASGRSRNACTRSSISLHSLETCDLLIPDSPILHQIVYPPGRHAADPGFLDHRDQRLLRGFAGFQKRREVAALPQLRDAQLQGAKPGVEGTVAVAVAPGGPLAAALATPSADQPLDFGLHQQLQHQSPLRASGPLALRVKVFQLPR